MDILISLVSCTLIIMYVLSMVMVIGIEMGLKEKSTTGAIIFEILTAPFFCALYLGMFLGRKI